MEALFLLIPLSVAIAVFAAWLFLRMSQSGQFDDLDSPAWSVLHDDDRPVADDDPPVTVPDDDSRSDNTPHQHSPAPGEPKPAAERASASKPDA